MAIKQLSENGQANESVSNYKLLSAYGGPGSIMHTQYGSIIISCIEEWGFLKRILELDRQAKDLGENPLDYVVKHARLGENGNIGISNDQRLLYSLKGARKKLENLQYLVHIPNIELKQLDNKVKNDATAFTIPSSFLPKNFSDSNKLNRSYSEWYNLWKKNNAADKYGKLFFPPKKNWTEKTENGQIEIESRNWAELLTQDNIVLICEHGHISDFPWSRYLNWRTNDPAGIHEQSAFDLFQYKPCCGSDNNSTSRIKINSTTGNASGFDGKWLKCDNCKKQISLKGLMGVKIKCPGHLPWEVETGEAKFHSGNHLLRAQNPKSETCSCTEIRNGKALPKPMKVALTTGNNLYFSRIHSSIFMPDELFEDEITLEINKLEKEKEKAKEEDDLVKAIKIQEEIKKLKEDCEDDSQDEDLTNSEQDVRYRYQEFKAFTQKTEEQISVEKKHLKAKDVTENLEEDLEIYFSKVLRIDTMKITSVQLDFSRVVPADADVEAEQFISKNIFRSKPNEVVSYPAVENFGEGIFFALDEEAILDYGQSDEGEKLIKEMNGRLQGIRSDSFSKGAIEFAKQSNWELYLVHTFAHLIMRELEFRCGYPTASLSERIYVSNDEAYKMYGCMIYTAEGTEGSMGGLIAQTRKANLNNLIRSALKRATICHSDPLCWESEGQGLFDLNFSSCFSCSLVSETSCEHRNIYLDRRILVDETSGFFRSISNM